MLTAVVFLLSLLAQGIPIQPQQGGEVRGILRDSLGQPVVGVRIAAVSRIENIADAGDAGVYGSIAETDEQGRYILSNIPPGRYSIAAGRLDLQTYHPGTQVLSEATVITIVAGTMVSAIDFAMGTTSFGRANSFSPPAATVPVRVIVEGGGKLPISANGKFTRIKVQSPSARNSLTLPLNSTYFTVPGPSELRVTVEDLPDGYVLKSIRYGSTDVIEGLVRLTAANFSAPGTVLINGVAIPGDLLKQGIAENPRALQAFLTTRAAAGGLQGTGVPVADISSDTSPTFNATNASGPALPTELLTITLGKTATISTGGVRVSGRVSGPNRMIYLSGNPGMIFSDGTFEFYGVPPGRHWIATANNPTPSLPQAAAIVVGNSDLNGIELETILLLPQDVRTVRPPLAAETRVPGSVIPLARLRARVSDASKGQIPEGTVWIKNAEHTTSVLLDSNGQFELPLLPGTYSVDVRVIGYAATKQEVVIGGDDIQIEVVARRLY